MSNAERWKMALTEGRLPPDATADLPGGQMVAIFHGKVVTHEEVNVCAKAAELALGLEPGSLGCWSEDR